MHGKKTNLWKSQTLSVEWVTRKLLKNHAQISAKRLAVTTHKGWLCSYGFQTFFGMRKFLTKIKKRLQLKPFIMHLKAVRVVQQVFFLSLFSCNFNDHWSPNYHWFVILCMCWDTPSENTGLWQYQTCPVPLTTMVYG